MKNKNRHSAEYLFDSIGGIDDRFIAEAQNYRPAYARRRAADRKADGSRTPARRYPLIAVAAALVLCIMIVPAVLKLSSPDSNTSNGPSAQHTTLSSLLAERSATMTPLAVAPDLRDGQARLVWRMGDALYAVNLSTQQLMELTERMSSAPCRHTDATSESGVSVWICSGRGTVCSPELIFSAGNVGYGTLFDYSAEIDPAATVVSYIRNIVEA